MSALGIDNPFADLTIIDIRRIADGVTGATLLLGLLLLLSGIAYRRAKAPPGVLQPLAKYEPGYALPAWSPAPYPPQQWLDEDAANGEPPPSVPKGPQRRGHGGVGRIVVGSILTVIALLAGLVMVGVHAEMRTRDRTTVGLPLRALGLERQVQDGLGPTRQQFQDDLPRFADEANVAFYGTTTDGIFALVARAWVLDVDEELAHFGREIRRDAPAAGAGTAVQSGSLGGKARCWKASGLTGSPTVICYFVDKGSIFTTLDVASDSIAASASRGRALRALTVHRT